MQQESPHSAEYFGDHRNFWWNQDFLNLMGKRWDLSSIRSVLDVGSGLGHFAKALSTILPTDAKIIGLDREETWVREGQMHLKFEEGQYQTAVGSMEKIPFPDASFDMVACQTVLLHVSDAKAGLKEMLRVLKPGGLLVTVEPNNCISEIVFDTLSINEPLQNTLKAIEFYLTCAKGQQELKLGCDKIGDVLPGYFVDLGLKNIQVFQSDKTVCLFPPYDSQEQKLFIQDLHDWYDQDLLIWNKEESLQYYLAAGGTLDGFDLGWKFLKERAKKRLEAIENKTYATSGGCLFYLISGRKEG